ncbi:hypothetical protein [Candidatus Nitrosotenuis uzonensis]|uniref:Uncharacterized protein n=1 Tax=Candidatus Nitrosotenuis uzonensis TaxID=1407055 RepID=V6AQM9_9ARCH|nr:hypothetical protein [Candidatus Nitrosotenuis uzonensis]CDI04937.1 exported hypothetical protein [Candidatus Nitrosotenuis uzonensis]
MNLSPKIILLIIAASAAPIMPITISLNQEESQTKFIEIDEDTTFDPVCLNSNRMSSELFDQLCRSHGEEWYVEMGGSTNVRFLNDYLSKIFFTKIILSDIPTSDATKDVKIDNAKLRIGTLYQSINFTTMSKERFVITYGFCSNTNWSENTTTSDLPCINVSGSPIMEIDSFYGILNPERISSVELDIKPHVDFALEKKSKRFTEMITLFPSSFLENEDRIKLKECIEKYDTESNQNDCIRQSQILIYSSEFSLKGFKPQIQIDYTVSPTSLSKTINAIVFAIYPLLSSFFIYRWQQEISFNNKMIKVCESLKEEISDSYKGLRDGVGKVKPTQTVNVEFDDEYSAITFTLTKPFTEIILFTDAYKGILHSGSFENFTKEHQIDISTFYNRVNEYNKTMELYATAMEQSRLSLGSKDQKQKLEWGLRKNIGDWLKYMIELRDEIIKSVENNENGILKTLDDEIQRFRNP